MAPLWGSSSARGLSAADFWCALAPARTDLKPPDFSDARPLVPTREEGDGPAGGLRPQQLQGAEGAAAPYCYGDGGEEEDESGSGSEQGDGGAEQRARHRGLAAWRHLLGRGGSLRARAGSTVPWTANATVGSAQAQGGFWATLGDMVLDIAIVARWGKGLACYSLPLI